MSDADRMVTAVFPDNAGVERAYEAALAHGYQKDELNVVMSDETRRRLYENEPDVDLQLTRKAAEGGELGGPTGLHVAVGIPVVAAALAANRPNTALRSVSGSSVNSGMKLYAHSCPPAERWRMLSGGQLGNGMPPLNPGLEPARAIHVPGKPVGERRSKPPCEVLSALRA